MQSFNTDKVFVTGIGTGIGKTVVSAILVEALGADYWKPVQAGYEDGTDSGWIGSVISNKETKIYKEAYKLKLPASPNIAANKEQQRVDLNIIQQQMPDTKKIIIEGAGGLMVPLNEEEFVTDLIVKLDVPVVLVSRNYLGSINHSLLTAQACKAKNIDVIGWIFNDHFMDYEEDIVRWSGYPRLASIPFNVNINKQFISSQAVALRNKLMLS